MVELARIRSRDRHPCYVLRVAGLPVLYGTHTPPSLTVNGVTYARRSSIVPGDMSFGRRIDESTGFVEVDNLTFTLASDELHTADPFDPGKMLGRVGYVGADANSRVTDTVESGDPGIPLEDTSGFAAGDIVHLGLETMVVTTVVAGGIGVTRGALDTFPRKHLVNEADGSFPYLTKPLTYFRGRRVVVYEGVVEDDGSVSENLSDYSECFRGFMATEPASGVSGKSTEITLEIAPLTSVLDKTMPSATTKANLHPFWHSYDGHIGCRFCIFTYHRHNQLYRGQGVIDYTGGGFKLNYTTTRASSVAGRFDKTIADFHPRGFELSSHFATRDDVWVAPGGVNTTSNPGKLDSFYPPSTVTALNNLQSILDATHVVFGSKGKIESKVCLIAAPSFSSSDPTLRIPTMARWKENLEQRVESELQSGTIAGLGGFLCDVTLDTNAGMTYLTPNIVLENDGPPAEFNVILANDPQHAWNHLTGLDDVQLDEGLKEITGRVANSDATTGFVMTTRDLVPAGSLPFFRPALPQYLPMEVLGFSDPDRMARVVTLKSERFVTLDGGTSVPTPVADAYYICGPFFRGAGVETPSLGMAEQFITLDVDFGLTGDTTLDVAVMKGEEKLMILTIRSGTVQAPGAYTYRVDKVVKYQNVPCIVDMPGEERHTFVPAVLPMEDSIGLVLLKLLCSTYGESMTSSTYDTLALGAGLSDGTGATDTMGPDIDVASFLAIPNPTSAEVFGPILNEDDTLLESIQGTLMAVGYALDISTDDLGRCMLRAKQMGLPNASDVRQAFTSADIAEDPVPTSETEYSIKNVFKFKANHDFEGEAQVELTVRDQASIDLFNEVEEMDVDLKGLRVNNETPGDAVNSLRPMFSRLRMENSFPRRLFRFDVPTGLLQRLALGDSCTVTHPLLRGTSGLGVTTEASRVNGIEYDGFSPVGTIELISYGHAGASWNMGLTIVGISTGTSNFGVVVKENDNSPLLHPSAGTDLEDLSAFKVGDTVKIYSAYDMDSHILKTQVDAIKPSTNQIFFKHAVNSLPTDSLALGYVGFVVPTERSDAAATDEQKKYAYIGQVTTT